MLNLILGSSNTDALRWYSGQDSTTILHGTPLNKQVEVHEMFKTHCSCEVCT